MPKKERASISRRHIYLFDDDWDFVTQHFDASVGVSTCIREVLHTWVEGVRAKIEAGKATPAQSAVVPLPAKPEVPSDV